MVADEKRVLRGFIAPNPATRALGQIFLRPDQIGRGLGRRQMAPAKARMPEGFELFTPAANTRARGFHKAAGMRIAREDVHPVFGHPNVYYAWTPD